MEAEMIDEFNPNVWVQLGMYFSALGNPAQAIEALSKALVIDPENVPAVVHLAHLYLTSRPSPSLFALVQPSSSSKPANSQAASSAGAAEDVDSSGVEMATGMLEALTRRAVGWDVPEAWYFLAKATGLQGRKDRQRECLAEALRLEEGRCVRSLKVALPRCL